MGVLNKGSWFVWFLDSVTAFLLTFLEDILDSDTGPKLVLVKLMALFVGPTALERLRSILSKKVVEGENPRRLFCVPVFLRRDGAVLRVGGIVQVVQHSSNEDLRFCIKDILISYDLEQVFACLVPVSMDQSLSEAHKVLLGEEMMVDLNLLVNVSDVGMARTIVMDGMNKILSGISTYPIQIQRALRKHQLCSSIRKDIQRFLSGFSIAQSWTLGTVDWRLDPGIFGLEKETDFTMDFHIEKFSTSVAHIDLLLGEGWDVKAVAGNSGYRAVITLELSIDANQQDLKLKAHAVICSGELDQKHHRLQTLKSLQSSEYQVDPSGLKSCENTLTRQENSFALFGTGRSLTWEEFRNIEEYNLSSAECSPRGHQYKTMSLDSSLFQSNASAAANALQELLRKANFNSQNFYYYSPVGKQQKLNDKKSSSKRPSTSTPADEMENCRQNVESRGSGSTAALDSTEEAGPNTAEPGSDTFSSEDLTPANAFSSFETIKLGAHPFPGGNNDQTLGVGIIPVESIISNNMNKTGSRVECPRMEYGAPVLMKKRSEADHSDLNLSIESEVGDLTQRPRSSESTPTKLLNKGFLPRSLDSLLDSSMELNQSHENNMKESEDKDVSDCISPFSSLPNRSDLLQLKVVQYINSLPTGSDRSSFSGSPGRPAKSPVTLDSRAKEDGNVSVCSSRSRASRGSDLGSLSGRFGQGILGSLYGVGVPSDLHCPFPEEWQYNTIPEVIENDDEVD